MNYPSQAQTGLIKGLEGFFTGLNKGDDAAKKNELRLKYLEAQQAGRQPYQTAMQEYRDKKLAQDKAKADEDRASRERMHNTPKPGGAATKFPSLNTNETRNAARLAAEQVLRAAGAKTFAEATPETQADYKAAFKNTYVDRVQKHNQHLRGLNAPQSLFVNEDPGEFMVETKQAKPDTAPAWWFSNAEPAEQGINPNFGLTGGGSSKPAEKVKETFAQRTARLAAEAAK